MLLRWIYWAVIIYFLYLVWRFIRTPRKRPSRRENRSKSLPQMMVKDEVCNTYLPVQDAIKEVYQGREYYFCSRECRQKFLDQKKTGA
jgi:uncharacterized protein